MPNRELLRRSKTSPRVPRGADTAVILAALVLATSSARAHHSYAMFDHSKTVVVHGTVAQLEWKNPHVVPTADSNEGRE